MADPVRGVGRLFILGGSSAGQATTITTPRERLSRRGFRHPAVGAPRPPTRLYRACRFRYKAGLHGGARAGQDSEACMDEFFTRYFPDDGDAVGVYHRALAVHLGGARAVL